MRFGGVIIRTGVYLPPESGPARAEHCIGKGISALRDAERAWGTALLSLLGLLDASSKSRPSQVRVPPGRPQSLQAYIHAQEVIEWKRVRVGLQSWLRDPYVEAAGWPGRTFAAAEQPARAALQGAIEAFYWFDDVLWDYAEDALIDLGASQPTLGFLAERAHRLAHDVGETVGGLFRCKMHYKDGVWFRRCALTIMHNRFGLSPGMSMDYECGICGGDPLKCPHEPDAEYSVVAELVDGACGICAENSCAHIPGTAYLKRARLRPVNLSIREVSQVPRPADPLARFTDIEEDGDGILAEVGFIPEADQAMWCYSCIGQCRGLRERKVDPFVLDDK